ncbi:hypothetical protein [Flavobacterium selenitireducens]|uniref:hypothetical protein n=1 Tax=Flavobacterium selenitireducens TaxID=2722704 RepID=UPI00168A55BB|nr:hypothetical protein [Flavobacterium selenitireducens]MBD3581994.1 hypothetical protein [Flavobacterium selenitireducens]
MHKIIFKFATVVTTAIVSHTTSPKLECPRILKPEIRVEKVKANDFAPEVKLVSNKKTALS